MATRKAAGVTAGRVRRMTKAGKTRAEIAKQLGISVQSVRYHQLRQRDEGKAKVEKVEKVETVEADDVAIAQARPVLALNLLSNEKFEAVSVTTTVGKIIAEIDDEIVGCAQEIAGLKSARDVLVGVEKAR